MSDNSFVMRVKTILSTAAFVIAFVFSTAFASLFIKDNVYELVPVVPTTYNRTHTSCFKNRGNNTANKIETLLKQDDLYGRDLDRKLFQIDRGLVSPFTSSSYSEYADGVTEYADQSGNLSTNDLPKDFQIAWNAHMKAWRDYADFLDRMKSSSARARMDKENLGSFEDEYNNEINSTWYEVLRVADEYGADFH